MKINNSRYQYKNDNNYYHYYIQRDSQIKIVI